MLSAIWKKKKKEKTSMEATLGFDEQQKTTNRHSNAVINTKSILYLNEDDHCQSEAAFSDRIKTHHQYSYCFLQFCHLCHKPLSLDKEVYMYRGDVGFCSVQCRSKQMYLDEMKKIEITTMRILASFHRRRRGRCEIGAPAVAPPVFISK